MRTVSRKAASDLCDSDLLLVPSTTHPIAGCSLAEITAPMTHQRQATVITADVLEWAKTYDGPPHHALLTDAPYHLTSERFPDGGASRQPSTSGPHRRTTPAAGFMGQAWDGGDVAFRPETWKALSVHLYPGAFLFAFASSRGWHRMAVAMEDAGLIMHPSIGMLGYVFGSGFPKATRIDTQCRIARGWLKEKGERNPEKGAISNSAMLKLTLKERALWRRREDYTRGHRYGLQAIKPALEPILCFQKPYEGRPVDNIVETGAGALNIAGGRIGSEDRTYTASGNPGGNGVRLRGGDGRDVENARRYAEASRARGEVRASGRWPSNLVLVHAPECQSLGEGKWDCSKLCVIRDMDTQSGVCAPGHHPATRNAAGLWSGEGGGLNGNTGTDELTDKGGASRYFFNADWLLERLEGLMPFHYTSKPGRDERDLGLSETPLTLRSRVNPGGLEKDPKWAPVEARNHHTTVKPLSLARWLATLLLPPAEHAPRRILVPFAGSGSEAIGAVLAGWESVTAIELEPGHSDLARARLAYWMSGRGLENTATDAVPAAKSEAEQLALF